MRGKEVSMRLEPLAKEDLELICSNNIKYIKNLMLSLFKLKGSLRGSFKETLGLILALLLASTDELSNEEYEYLLKASTIFNLDKSRIEAVNLYLKVLRHDDEFRGQLFKSFSKALNAIPSLDINEAASAVIAYLGAYILLYREINDNDIRYLDELSATMISNSSKDDFIKIKMSRSGASLGNNNGEYLALIGAELINNNKNAIALDVVVEVICYDKDKNVIATNRDIIPAIDQNSKFYYGIEINTHEKELYTYSLNVLASQFIRVIPNYPRLTNVIRINDLRLTSLKDGYSLRGSIKNPYEGMVAPSIYFILYDDSKDIIGGYKSNRIMIFHGRSIEINSTLYGDDLGFTKDIKYSVAFNLTEINRRFK